VGEQIRDARERLGISQGELATRAGIARRPTVSDAEAGANTTLDVLQRLATALQCSLVIASDLPAPWTDRPGRGSGKKKKST
jgi:transcriptional regulator with XRE-family HTH domain